MKIEKRLLMRIFFAGEIIIFSLIYLIGSHGVYAVMQLQHENTDIEVNITRLEHDINTIEQTITAWKKNEDYFIEEEARKLLLADPQDLVFYR